MRHSQDHDPLERINTHRRDELLAIVRAYGGRPDAEAVRAEGVDRTGIDVVVERPPPSARVRIDFPEPVEDFPSGVRLTFVRLARQAHAQGPVPGSGDG